VSWKYRKDKPDATKQEIVDEMRARGYEVIELGRPCDIAVRHKTWVKNWWRLAEIKSRKDAKGKVVLDKRQEKQKKFCEEQGVPYVVDAFELRLAIGEKVKL
jgi:hypothetical protein